MYQMPLRPRQEVIGEQNTCVYWNGNLQFLFCVQSPKQGNDSSSEEAIPSYQGEHIPTEVSHTILYY